MGQAMSWTLGSGPRITNRGQSCPLSERALEIVDGMLLGDGSLSHPNILSTYLSLSSSKGPSFPLWLGEELAKEGIQGRMGFKKRNGVLKSTGHPRIGSWKYISLRYKEWSDQRNRWYPEGIKIVPQDVRITPLSTLIWYLGDGTLKRAIKGEHTTFYIFLCTNGFTKEDCDHLCNRLCEKSIIGPSLRGVCKPRAKLDSRGHPKIYLGPPLVSKFLRYMTPLPIQMSCAFGYKWRSLDYARKGSDITP